MFLFILKLFLFFLLFNNMVLANVITDVVCSLIQPDSKNASFYLYTKSIDDYSITADANSIEKAPFTADSNTVIFIIHGFGASRTTSDIVTLRKAFISAQEEYNIVMVDYHDVTGDVSKSNIITEGLEYIEFIHCDFKNVVTTITDMIVSIQSSRPEITYIQLVGHSIGAQLAGEAGNTLRGMGKTIDRVSGLDPAAPGFFLSSITPESAIFVDVTHTQIGNLYGAAESSGNVDFYFNNAVIQDGCRNEKTHEMALKCSHSSAVYYFADSIKNQNIMASRCDKIKEIVQDVFALNNIDKNNNNELSSVCSQEAKNDGNKIVYGEYVSLEANGVYFVKIAKVPNSS
ncbi:phospholipase A1-like [Adelges cooleyi]|uniref:phospholipase A1-like n=1 Tax=Adelges cooleyi TaxID=133065 RepID=UPI00217F2599|nr:phospholipase A1-like [Adelges cooleyi]XP_050424188.1 phospholipase A1-like [Adelges cooleyi]